MIFKGRKNGIDVWLDENTEYDKLKADLTQKSSEARKFFKDAKTAVGFTGYTLTDEQKEELLAVLMLESQLEAHASEAENDKETRNTADGALKDIDGQTGRLFSKPIGVGFEQNAYFHTGSLRSGQSLRYAGSVVILGDANPGSEIIAEGNVIVLGTLKGMVHAGSGGDTSRYVAALTLQPIQLRIGDIITYIPNDKSDEKRSRRAIFKKERKKKPTPSCAYINEGQIYIAPIGNL